MLFSSSREKCTIEIPHHPVSCLPASVLQRSSGFGRGYSVRHVPPAGGGDCHRPSQPARPGSAIPRESRNVADYYDEQTGPRVRAANSWGTHQSGGSGVSVDSSGDDFPSLSDSMQSRSAKPKSGRTYSTATAAPSDSVSLASERSAVPPSMVSAGARPKARLAAQFPEPPAVLQGLGRGTIPGAEQHPPRRPQDEPSYRGIGRGNM